MMPVADFKDCMDRAGFVIFENFIHPLLIQAMRDDLHRAYMFCQRIQNKNGVENSEGTAHHLVGLGDSFTDYLYQFEGLNEYISTYFSGRYILNSFGGNLLKARSSYANEIHRDQRSFSSFLPLMLNSIVTLDDFSVDNGATWLMVEGHKYPNKPTQEEFKAKAIQAIAPAGSVIVFNSNMWHCAGENKTSKPRRSVTPMFSKPFIKPGFDYCRSLGEDAMLGHTEWLKQILGYNSRIPAAHDEWYRKPEDRFYRGDQG